MEGQNNKRGGPYGYYFREECLQDKTLDIRPNEVEQIVGPEYGIKAQN